MAKRHPKEPPAPFPEGVDRRHFSSWLSGFTDGEGSFRLGINTIKSGARTPWGEFTISLREDDTPILQLIRSFFQCGHVYNESRSYTTLSAAPKASFRVRRTSDLLHTVLPHFDRFPLFAKKQQDFSIWKGGVILLSSVLSRPRGYGAKRLSQWTQDELCRFANIASSLRQIRTYKPLK